jgi:hypothetical protein
MVLKESGNIGQVRRVPKIVGEHQVEMVAHERRKMDQQRLALSEEVSDREFWLLVRRGSRFVLLMRLVDVGR